MSETDRLWNSMRTKLNIPQHLTHYYRQRPFRTLTELDPEKRSFVIQRLRFPKYAAHRLHSPFYWNQRLRYEQMMYEQFLAKGGEPTRRRPHYAILGESEIWAGICRRSLRIPLSAIPSSQISFTYTDSWSAYVDRDLEGKLIPRKPQYGMVYRLEELDELFRNYGWPGERWKTEPEWEHDLYVEAQIWSEAPLATYIASTVNRVTRRSPVLYDR